MHKFENLVSNFDVTKINELSDTFLKIVQISIESMELDPNATSKLLNALTSN